MPGPQNLVVIGGSGYVGTRIIRQALRQGHKVTSISRSGGPPAGVTPAHELEGTEWVRGDATTPEVWARVKDADGIISALGIITGSNERMRAINGDANIGLIRAAASGGVKRFVYVSAAEYGVVERLLPGYFEGKRAAENEIEKLFGAHGTILRPGMVYGTRQVGRVKLPLWLLGAPLEVIGASKPGSSLRSALGYFGGVLTPAIDVDDVAAAAVAAATSDSGSGGDGEGSKGKGGQGKDEGATVRRLDYAGMIEEARRVHMRSQDDPSSSSSVVELFWDGGCPMCKREIEYYRGLDRDARVRWTDIHSRPEALDRFGIPLKRAMERIHAIKSDGKILTGVPAFLAVWEQLPYWRALPPVLTATPGVVPLAEAAYGVWARHRLAISGRVRPSLGATSGCAAAGSEQCSTAGPGPDMK